MSFLPILTSSEVIRALERVGFQAVRQRGSHVVLRHPDGRRTVVPAHQGHDIDRGLLVSILKDASLSQSQFIALL